MQVAPILIMLCVTAPAQAFDAWGFHSGMTEAQVIAAAQLQGDELASPIPDVDMKAPYHRIQFVPKGGSADHELGYEMSFCEHHLFSVSRTYRPTMNTLFNLFSALKPSYGVPTATAVTLGDGEDQGRSIEYRFRSKPDDALTIVTGLATMSVEAELAKDNEATFGVQVFHSTTAETACR